MRIRIPSLCFLAFRDRSVSTSALAVPALAPAFKVALLVALLVVAPNAYANSTAEDQAAQAPNAASSDAALDAALDAEFDWEPEDVGFPDPFEEVNRGVLHVNQGLDRWLFEPMTDVYRFLVPSPARDGIRRAFLNVGSVSVLANDILQLEGACARETLLRLVLNTTVGVGGLFDPAAKAGLKGHYSDFGQTLAKVGVGSGPYTVLPLLGPSTARDAFGTFVDTLLQPAFYLLAPVQRLTVGGSFGLSSRDAHGEALAALEESSLDFYAALRNAFYQARIAEIEAENSCPCPPADASGNESK